MKEELKEAFRIYDKEGQGFITTDVLKVELPFRAKKNLHCMNCFLFSGDSARDRHDPD